MSKCRFSFFPFFQRKLKAFVFKGLIFLCFSIVMTGFSNQAQAQTAVCKSDIQNKIAWDYSGNKRWSSANVAKLCQGAETSSEPARCFEKVLHGRDERWKWQDAIELCKGSLDHIKTVDCLQSRLSAGRNRGEAIRACVWTNLAQRRSATAGRVQPTAPRPTATAGQVQPTTPQIILNTNGISGLVFQNSGSTRMTRFDPVRDGFKFENGFRNNFISELDIQTGGLCGGMVYSALDYFWANKDIPNWAFMPPEHDPLRKYIYNRQITSNVDNADKWAEFFFNPFGSRNDEFFNWGLEAKPGGRIDELKRKIDAGEPVPLGLRSCGDSCFADHQVLAIGYDMGRYKGDLGDFKEDFKIKVYDPNIPGRTMTLIPDVAAKRYVYAEDADTRENPRKGWMAYYVDSKYTRRAPLDLPQTTFPDDGKIHALAVEFRTGEDDLRGGSFGNLEITVFTFKTSGNDLEPRQVFRNVNHSQRWVSGGKQWVRLDLENPIEEKQLHKIVLYKMMDNDSRADNWDIKNMSVVGVGNNIKHWYYNQPGNAAIRGLVRMTRQQRKFTAMINRYPPRPTIVQSSNDPSTFEPNSRRTGDAYKTIFLDRRASGHICKRQCNRDAQCRAYTYSNTLTETSKHKCELYSTIEPKLADTSFTSGVKIKYIDWRNPQ